MAAGIEQGEQAIHPPIQAVEGVGFVGGCYEAGGDGLSEHSVAGGVMRVETIGDWK